MARRGIAARLALAAAGAIACTCVVGGALALPSRGSVGKPSADLGATPVRIPSGSGATLAGWLVRGTSGHGAVLLLHGVRANRTSMLGRARFLHDAGYTVLLVDFQAHGESSGNRITFG